MTVLGVVGAVQLRMDPNILVLLPEDEPTSKAIHQLNAEEGGANLLTVVARGEDTVDLDAFMRELRDAMEASDQVDYALFDMDPELAWRLGVLQLTPQELAQIQTRLQAAISLGPTAANPFVASRLLDLGPLTEKLSVQPDQGNFAGGADGLRRLIIRPTSTPYDPVFSKRLMADLDAHIERLSPGSRGIEVVWIGGAYRHSVEDVRNLTKDLGWTGAVSLALVLLLIGFAFRNVRAVVLVFLPLVAANLWTAGFAGVAIGTLNTFTSFFPAVLIGLGVDFSIHLFARYREERATGEGSSEDAIVRAWDKVGPPCLTAGLTTAGGFCALWAAGFAGFRQLGTILAAGVLFSLIAVVVTLPLLLCWLDPAREQGGQEEASSNASGGSTTYARAPVGLVGLVLMTLLAGTLVPQVSFEFDISELRPKGLSYSALSEVQQKLAREAAAPVVVSFDDREALAEAHERVTKAIDSGEMTSVSTVVDIFTVLPLDQSARLEGLRAIAALASDDNVRFLPKAVQDNLRRIASSELSPVQVEDLPRGAQHMLGASAGHHRMMLLPSGNMWDIRQNRRLYEDVKRWLPGERAAGEYLALAVLFELVQGDTPRVAGIALLIVFVCTLAYVRRVGQAVGAVLALLAGMSWAGAAMVLFGLKLSLVNFVGVPILMGIGVDVIIHLLHRVRQEGPGRVGVALRTTGWASGLSAATTVFSFAALSVATAEGIRSLGLLIVMGLTLVALAGLTIVPLGWMCVWRFRPAKTVRTNTADSE